QRHGAEIGIPKPLDTAIERMWGYASEMVRHLREGRVPAREEAEFLRIRPANADYGPQISSLLLLLAGARRYSYSPWSLTWTFTRSGKSSARPPARFVNVSASRTRSTI